MHWTQRRRRPPKYNEPGDCHELTFSCYHGLPLLKADRRCAWLAETIDRARRELDLLLWAYVFMPEHVHLIVWLRRSQYSMADIRAWIKEPVARQALAFLRKHSPDWLPRLCEPRRRRPEYHFWQPGGGYGRNIIEPRTLMAASTTCI